MYFFNILIIYFLINSNYLIFLNENIQISYKISRYLLNIYKLPKLLYKNYMLYSKND